MPPVISDDNVKYAITDSVKTGSYPEAENVAAAEVHPRILPALHKDLQQARSDVEAQVRQLSRDSAPDIDNWIAQAKRVQADIERSKLAAREIIQQAESGRHLQERATEAGNKVDLLQKEVGFNESLASILGEIRSISGGLEDAKADVVHGNLEQALAKLQHARNATESIRRVENTRAYGLVQNRIRNVHDSLIESVKSSADQLVDVDVPRKRVKIGSDVQEPSKVGIETVVKVLDGLDSLKPWLERLARLFDRALFVPLLTVGPGGTISGVTTSTAELYVSQTSEKGLSALLHHLEAAFEFMSSHLPGTLRSSLSPVLLPRLIDRLDTAWLTPSVPVRIDDMQSFEGLLQQVSGLAAKLEQLGWLGIEPLKAWVEGAPRIWLARRREISLNEVRNLLSSALKDRQTVERVETQTVSKSDVMMGGTDEDDSAWDEEWTEESSKTVRNEAQPSQPVTKDDDDDDASAWDMDAGTVATENEPVAQVSNEDEEAWGWGDDEQTQTDSKQAGEQTIPITTTNGNSKPKASTERELTLKETYTITAVPDGVVDVVANIVSDAEALSTPSLAHSPVAAAGSALYTLPTLALAMYRAAAPTSYSKLESGNMLIYNDSSRLADQIRGFFQSHPSRMKLDTDIKNLETFAKRAYGTEMESQRTVLRDLLDGAQGFSNCTTPPFSGECDSAIAMTVDRLREVYRQWEHILSRSALLQSLGSLLSTVTSKVLLDIEDLADIGEEESKRLKSYCDSISSLRDLFVNEHPSGEGSGDMTGIYCPNWFKFQYLAEILDSSLADIKYLWTEGELSLEFESDEIMELIEALFADSDYRRRAITDIKRSGRR